MASPITGDLYFEMNWNLEGQNCPIWKSPIGYVVPFKDFERYTKYMMQKYSHAQDSMLECTEDLKRGTSLFEETTDYIEKRHLTMLKEMSTEMMIFRIALVIVTVIAVALGVALAIVLL